jgi:hypothetical protein
MPHSAQKGIRAAVCRDDDDRARFLDILGRTVELRGWICRASGLMGNRYHLVMETAEANLSRGMRSANGGHAPWAILMP